MPESSPENQQGEPAQDQKKLVPVEAVAKERSEKRAARAEADALKQELAKQQTMDAESLGMLVDKLSSLAAAQVEEATRPLQELKVENDRLKLAVAHGLSNDQANKVMEVQSQHPSLTTEQALLLARTGSPDLFPGSASQQPRNRAIPGALPVGGNSMARNPASEDFTAKMREAAASGDRGAAMQYAEKAFVQRVSTMFKAVRPQYQD